MLFRKNPEKMTAEEQRVYLANKLGASFIKPMFEMGFTHFMIASILARASGECCPSKTHLEDLHHIMNAGFDMMGGHLAKQLGGQEKPIG